MSFTHRQSLANRQLNRLYVLLYNLQQVEAAYDLQFSRLSYILSFKAQSLLSLPINQLPSYLASADSLFNRPKRAAAQELTVANGWLFDTSRACVSEPGPRVEDGIACWKTWRRAVNNGIEERGACRIISSIALAAHQMSEEIVHKIREWRAEMDVFVDASIILLNPKWKPRDCALSRTLKSHF